MNELQFGVLLSTIYLSKLNIVVEKMEYIKLLEKVPKNLIYFQVHVFI